MEAENIQIGTYTITTPSGRVYVGVTNGGYSARWKQHEKLLRRGVHHCTGLQNSYNKYGWENLIKEPAMAFDPPSTQEERDSLGTFLLAEEVKLWRELKENGTRLLNGEPTGTGSVYHQEESREKLKESTKLYKNRVCKIYSNNCIKCSSEFYSGASTAKYCYTCIPRWAKEKRKYSPISSSRICAATMCCNLIPGNSRKYCGTECRESNHYSIDAILLCAFCTERIKNPSKYTINSKAFCNRKCNDSYRAKKKAELISSIIALVDTGLSISAIARQVGCSKQVATRYIREAFPK